MSRPENLELRGDDLPVVLVVDDDAHILLSLERAMRRMPWRICKAEGGQAALAVLEAVPVQVIIADYQMPGMNGIVLLNEVKQRWPDVQRVMLTGAANLEVIELAVNQSEVFRFLNKPWNDSHLKATVRECLQRVELERRNRMYEREIALRNEQLESINRDLEAKVAERTAALLHFEKMAALGRMAGGVAHEINNPLGGILAFAQVLLRDAAGDDSDPGTREALEAIQTCAIRCKNIVDSLLSFSRKPAAGALGEVALNEVASVSLDIARLHPKAKDVTVTCELGADVPRVIGQASLLQQVVVNMLQNAFQASPAGAPVVLRTSRQDGWGVLEVEDQGTGIDADDLPHIFEPFFTTKPTGEGTGLGLSICYGIVREHGGRIDVASEPGRGTVFSLRLPNSTAPREEKS
jgi:signal transduction histidine kinase